MPPIRRGPTAVARATLRRATTDPYPVANTPQRYIRPRTGSDHPRGILIEIEWWRVQPGQVPAEVLNELEEAEERAAAGIEQSAPESEEMELAASTRGRMPSQPVRSDGLLENGESIADEPTFVPCTPVPSPPPSPPPQERQRRRGRHRPGQLVRAASFAGFSSPGSTDSTPYSPRDRELRDYLMVG